MSRRVGSRNAYETTLNGAITGADLSILLTSAAGLPEPGYLVLEDEDPALREYIRFESITGDTLNSVTRGLTGSAAGGQAHISGAIVRAVAVAQWLDDIFDDIEDLETADGTLQSNIDIHIADVTDPHVLAGYLDASHLPGNPHTQYLQDTALHEADGADPHAAAGYLDQAAGDVRYMRVVGGTFTGAVVFSAGADLSGNRLQGVAAPVVDTDGLPKSFADATYLSLDGSVAMAGNIPMNGNRVRNLGDPVVGTDALSQDFADARYAAIGGGAALDGARATKSSAQTPANGELVTFDATDFDDDTLFINASDALRLPVGRWIVGCQLTYAAGAVSLGARLMQDATLRGQQKITGNASEESNVAFSTLIDVTAGTDDITVEASGAGGVALVAAGCFLWAQRQA
jgi:hypothetical protein